MEISQRINELISALGHNKSSFAQAIGVSQPIVTHITNGRNNPGLEVIQKILTKYPEVSAEWLVMGRGEMMLNNKLNKKIINDLYSALYIKNIQLTTLHAEVQDQLDILKRYIYTEDLESKSDLIATGSSTQK